MEKAIMITGVLLGSAVLASLGTAGLIAAYIFLPIAILGIIGLDN